MEEILQDARYGLRQLVRRPGLPRLMALGLGANTSIFSLVDTVLLRPLAVKNPSELVELYGTTKGGEIFSIQSYPNYNARSCRGSTRPARSLA